MLTKDGSGIPISHVLEDTRKSLKTQITKWSIVPDQIPQHTFNQASFVGLFSEGTVTKINEDRLVVIGICRSANLATLD